MDLTRTEIEQMYLDRRDRFAAMEARFASQDRMLTHLRTASFSVSTAVIGLGWLSGQGGVSYVAGGVIFMGFLALVAYHEHVQPELERYRLLRQINEQAIARLFRAWNDLPETSVEVPPKHQAIAKDLDLVGHASLFHLLCVANTPIGIRVLRDWLLDPASPGEGRLRQEAVVQLAPQRELRETLILEGRLLADRGNATDRFVAWAEGDTWLRVRPWLLWLCRILAAAGVLSIILTFSGALPAEVGGVAILVVLCLNTLATVLFGANVHDIFGRVNARSGEVRRYLRMFKLMYSMPDSTTKLDAIKREATAHGGGVLRRMRRLHLISELAAIRHSPLFFFFVYLPLQLLLLYDFQILGLLETWQEKYGRYARGWFVALGEFEALASLATLAHDNPSWALPEVAQSAGHFRAVRLGHPLLPDMTRVANDVEVGPAGSFLLVTGSNMSGKSTLLRAIGVNGVLAQAGAPVCASRLMMPPVVLATSMRIDDSLEHGVSFYMAQLMRLKDIVDLAGAFEERDDRRLLYLLDEILQGTNSRERHIAVVRVLQHLLGCGAIGAVSTHDLELATTEPLTSACSSVHFRETLHDHDAEHAMTFDYTLRSGVANTTNTMKLLEIVGLHKTGNLPSTADNT
jgi:hypothetical protein